MPAVIKMSVKHPATRVTRGSVNAAVETSEGHIEGEIPAENIAAGAVTSQKLADASVASGKLADASVTTPKLADAAVTVAKLAGVLVRGVVSAVKTDAQAVSPTAWAAVSGLSVSVTTQTGDRVLVIASLSVSGIVLALRLTRGGSPVAAPTGYGLKTPAMAAAEDCNHGSQTLVFLDTPGAGTYTYAVEMASPGSYDVYVNRGRMESDSAIHVRAVSTLTAVRFGPEAA